MKGTLDEIFRAREWESTGELLIELLFPAELI